MRRRGINIFTITPTFVAVLDQLPVVDKFLGACALVDATCGVPVLLALGVRAARQGTVTARLAVRTRLTWDGNNEKM